MRVCVCGCAGGCGWVWECSIRVLFPSLTRGGVTYDWPGGTFQQFAEVSDVLNQRPIRGGREIHARERVCVCVRVCVCASLCVVLVSVSVYVPTLRWALM